MLLKYKCQRPDSVSCVETAVRVEKEESGLGAVAKLYP